MKQLIQLAILVLFNWVCYSQLNPNTLLPNVMPSNPQAFQFMKYGEIPVSKYTGIPNTTINLYTINAEGITIPIDLTYHSNGFKVNEEAGWTGLGWTLNGGGAINQIVNGMDDFGYFKRRQLQNFTTDPLFNLSSSTTNSGYSFVIEGIPSPPGPEEQCVRGNISESSPQYSGYADSEPDIFKFSFLGYSGSFILDWQNNNFVCLSDKNIKIECTESNNTEFVPFEFFITTSDGNRFRFNIKEEGIYLCNYSYSEEYGTGFVQPDLRRPEERAFRTFQLTEIITNKNDVIKFNYTLSNEIVGYPQISKQFYFIEPIGSNVNLIPTLEYPAGYQQSDLTSSVILTKQKQSYLSSIVFRDGLIEFLNSDRLDINGAKKLDRINIKNPTTIIKSFQFNYDYFNAHNLGTNLDNVFNTIPSSLNANKTFDELFKRLKLLSVVETGQPPYLFEYYETQLPKKTSLATDYWGYYNGYLNNNNIFPDLYGFNLYRDKTYLLRFQGSNKVSSLEHSKASVLKKITYPTLGSTEFIYELNTFENYKTPDSSQGTVKTVNISTVPYSISGLSVSKSVIIEGGNTIFKGNAQLNTEGCYPQYPEAYSNCYVRIKHYKKEIIPIIMAVPNYQTYGIDYALTQINNVEQYVDFNNIVLTKMATSIPNENYSNLEYNLTEGVAVFSVSGGCGTYGSGASSSSSGNLSKASLNLTYRDYKPLTQIYSFGAGLRIKRIINYSNYNNLLVSRKDFQYEKGKLMNPVVYSKKTDFFESNLILLGTNGCDKRKLNGVKLIFNSSTIQPLSTNASGNYVGYDEVTEMDISNNYSAGTIIPTNGKIVSYYTNIPDATEILTGDNLTNQVMLPSEKGYIDNGLLIKEKYFKDDGILIKEISNAYQMVNSDRFFYSYRFAFKRANWFADVQCSEAKCQIYQIAGYTFKRRERPLLMSSLEKNFLGLNSFDKQKLYSYDFYNQVSKISETNSSGNLIETSFLYPYNLSSTNYNTYSGMVNRNMLTPVLEKLVKNNGNPISLNKTEYKWINTPNPTSYFQSTYAIDKIKQSISGEYVDLEDVVLFHSYDQYSNPTEVSKKDGTRISYIWGYKGKYLLAKIENASQPNFDNSTQGITIIPANLMADAITASNTGTEANLITALNALRTNLPNAMVTTYTYKPLVGVSTITDVKGDITKYYYDNSNRLQFVKDKDGNVLNENVYHYKN